MTKARLMKTARADIARLRGRFEVARSTMRARRYLKKNGPLSVLVDSSVLGCAITHETAWISTGTKKWGPHDFEAGYAARIPVEAPGTDWRVYEEIRYLPGIANLAKAGLLKLHTSAELVAERFRQPAGRYSGYGYYDHNLFRGLNFESLDGFVLDPWNKHDPSALQIARINSRQDEPFKSILDVLGEKNSFDAWHIHTAETHGLFCFLHIDFKLDGHVRSNRLKAPLSTLKTRILRPSELAEIIGLLPVDTALLSYEGASFPVHAELSVPGQGRFEKKRQKLRNP